MQFKSSLYRFFVRLFKFSITGNSLIINLNLNIFLLTSLNVSYVVILSDDLVLRILYDSFLSTSINFFERCKLFSSIVFLTLCKVLINFLGHHSTVRLYHCIIALSSINLSITYKRGSERPFFAKASAESFSQFPT